MNNTDDVKVTICDWCLQEAPVQTIQEKLWHFWKLISNEDPILISLKNICATCRSRYNSFSRYIERCSGNESTVEKILSSMKVKQEPSIDIEYHPLIKEDLLKGEESDLSYHTNEDLHSEVTKKSQNSTESVNSQDEPKTTTICSHCDKHFTAPSALKRHLRTHTGERPFKCSHCDKSFTQSSSLKSHLHIHTGDKSFSCPQCNKAFAMPCSLRRHVRIHSGEKPFKCSQCNRTFNRSSSLKRHLRGHTRPLKYFKCSYCHESFTESSQLKSHKRTHKSDRSFKCTICSKAFKQPIHLKNHMFTHTGEKPFKCSHCTKAFALSTSLRNHLRRLMLI